MAYCSDCGNEVGADVAYCPDCGNPIASDGKSDEHESKTETAPCRKCDSQISVEADRCPECGFEPSSHGILGGIFSIISVLWGGLGAILYLVAIAGLFLGTYSLGGFLGTLLFITVFSIAPFTYLYLRVKYADMGPTDEMEVFGETVN